MQVVDLGLPALSRPLAGVGAEEVDPFEGEEGDEGGMGDEEGDGLGPEAQVRGYVRGYLACPVAALLHVCCIHATAMPA